MYINHEDISVYMNFIQFIGIGKKNSINRRRHDS
jgi:hypothetical protein